jgi:hypothetical protein
MTRLLFLISLALFSTTRLSAAALTSDELQRASDHLEKTSAAFLASTAGLSDAQLNFKPTPVRWSVAQVAEHIVSAEDFLMTMVKDQVMKAPPRTEPADVREIDDFVLQAISDRTNKVQASEPLIPTNRFGSIEASRNRFKESRAGTLAFLKQTEDLRDHAVDSPLGKKLDAYQWLLFISAHCERHTKQINEVKADPDFPKS